jgi:REP element-mobilizing transposase RayT
MCRGNNGQSIFEDDDGRRLFLSTLDEVCEQTGWLIHAYVLMSNHYHLLLETPEANLVAGMKELMRFEEDPAAGMRGEFDKQIKRGWFIGSEEFRERLDALLMRRAKNDNHRGGQRQEHGPAEAERLIRKALKALGWDEDALLEAKSVQAEKQAVAWLVKTHTAVSGTWITNRLRMGHRTNCSRAISRFRHGKEMEVQNLKEAMLKCTG